MGTKIDFDKEEEWQLFGEAYIRHEGNMRAAAKEVGMNEATVYGHSSRNQDFRDWLCKLASKAAFAAVAAADARTANAVQAGKGLDPKLLKTQDQLYKRTDKIKPVSVNVNANGDSPFTREQKEKLINWEVEKRAREMVAAQRN